MSIIFLLFLSMTLEILSQSPQLLTLISQLEEELKARRNILEEAYTARCSKTCSLSYSSCGNIFPKVECSSRFNRSDCECYSQFGSLIGLKDSVVSVSNPYLEPTQDIAEMSCVLTALDSLFQSAANKYPQLRWQYAGAYNSVFRIYPGHHSCDYDPRYRPWYVASATGTKNVIIVIDSSNSMSQDSKLDAAKDATKAVINTLTIADWVGLVVFNSQANAIYPKLIRANSEARANLTSQIDQITADGLTNYEDAFRKAYGIIKDSKDDEIGSTSCQNIIIFLTDGNPQIGETNINKLVTIINSLEETTKADATILTYAFGQDTDISALLPISCARKGVAVKINYNSELKEKFLKYYDLLSGGMTRNDVIWTEPYDDAFMLGPMISAAIPFYERKNSNPPKMLGAVAVDIPLYELLNSDSQETLMKYLVSRSSGCTKFNFTQCQLQELRGQYTCPSPNCPSSMNGLIPCSSFITNPLIPGSKAAPVTETNYCCGDNLCNSKSGIIAGSVIGGVTFIALLTMLIIFLCNKNNCHNSSDSYPHFTRGQNVGVDSNKPRGTL